LLAGPENSWVASGSDVERPVFDAAFAIALPAHTRDRLGR
jgi:hypothetical protein